MTHLWFFFFSLVAGGSRAATMAWIVSEIRSWLGGCGTTYLVKDVLESLLGQGRALDVLDGTELSGHSFTVLSLDGLHLLLTELAEDGVLLVVALLLRWAQIELGTDNQARDTGAVVVDFGEPLLADVLEGSRRDDGEADEEDIGLGV
jgi:hypothetical protein